MITHTLKENNRFYTYVVCSLCMCISSLCLNHTRGTRQATVTRKTNEKSVLGTAFPANKVCNQLENESHAATHMHAMYL